MSICRVKNQSMFCSYCLLALYVTLAIVSVSEAFPRAQVDLQQENNMAAETVVVVPDNAETTEVPEPVETTTAHFLTYLFQREGNRDPWLAQLVKSTVPVLSENGIGGIIRQSFQAAPALALGAFSALANQRIGPLLNLPTIPTTTVIPPYKRYRSVSDADSE